MERYRTTLILVGVLVVLGGLAWFLNNRTSDVGISPTPEPAPYVWQDTNQVIAIDVVSATRKVRVQQDVTSTVWYVTEPIEDTAEFSIVNNVAGSLQNLAAVRVITDAGELAQYQLDKPSFMVTATFSDTQRTTRTLEVGGATIEGASYYVKQQGEAAVYIVSNGVIEPLRSWLESPPKAQPTPTPLPLVEPTDTVTGTVTITGTSPITGTAPGSADPTTPLPGTPEPTSTTPP